MRPLDGRPMLATMIDRLAQAASISAIMVATSDGPDDDAIADFCTRTRTACFRGSLGDVAARLADAARSAEAPAFARFSGDSPFMDPELVDAVVDLFARDKFDLATNIQARTFPKGQSVEVVRVDALRRAQAMMMPGEAEHVTPVFYRLAHDFRIVNLASGRDWGTIQMSIDTPQDWALAERMMAAMRRAPGRYDVVRLVALRERCLAEAA
jgi:spore coat polysaccharide biosynthesis protein SpsF (cytidylyltransferase family)